MHDSLYLGISFFYRFCGLNEKARFQTRYLFDMLLRYFNVK